MLMGSDVVLFSTDCRSDWIGPQPKAGRRGVVDDGSDRTTPKAVTQGEAKGWPEEEGSDQGQNVRCW